MSANRRIIGAFAAIVFIAALYRYWLIAPILQTLSLRQWHLVAFAIALACGAALSLLRLPAVTLACASIMALLVGGTWAAWQAPNDVPISLGHAFCSHLQSFWREVAMLATAVTVGGYSRSRFACSRFS